MEKLEKLLSDLADDIKPEVSKIESGIAATQNHYGDYMQILSMFSGNTRILIGLALIRAGANKKGVQDALTVLLG